MRSHSVKDFSYIFYYLRHRFVMRRAIAGLLFLLLLAYLCWEVYWYVRVGLSFIKWHTHLMLYVYPGVAIYAMSRGRRGGAVLAVISLLIVLFVVEGLLLISGRYATYVERREGSYVSPYGNPNTRQYNIYPPHQYHLLHTSEYSYTRVSNALGLSDGEWSVDQTSGRKRILALGDSFTEGDGAPFDSSYVALLRRYVGDSIEVLNAGTCGSDPFNNYMNLHDKLLRYSPNIIIQSLSSGDMNTDILLRGGMERVQGTHAPWWEPLYAISSVSRVFFRAAGYNDLLRKSEMTTDEKRRVNSSAVDLFEKYDDLCQKKHIQFFVVLHPYRSEVINNKYDYDFCPLLYKLRSDTLIHIIDLLPAYRDHMDHTHSDARQYYWPKDGHHNSRGYNMMAATTYEAIRPYLIDTSAH